MKNKVDEKQVEKLKEIYPSITDEQILGNAPLRDGDQWLLDNGEIVTGRRYVTWFGPGETIIDENGKEICVEFDGDFDDINVYLWGYSFPEIRIHDSKYTFEHRSDTWKSEIIARDIKRIMRRGGFQSHLGQLFLARVPVVLDFSFKKFVEGEEI